MECTQLDGSVHPVPSPRAVELLRRRFQLHIICCAACSCCCSGLSPACSAVISASATYQAPCVFFPLPHSHPLVTPTRCPRSSYYDCRLNSSRSVSVRPLPHHFIHHSACSSQPPAWPSGVLSLLRSLRPSPTGTGAYRTYSQKQRSAMHAHGAVTAAYPLMIAQLTLSLRFVRCCVSARHMRVPQHRRARHRLPRPGERTPARQPP